MAVDLTSIVDANISRYTVGFVLVDNLDPRPHGSGVLVQGKSVQGILTCGHVVAGLPQSGPVGIVQFGVVSDRLQTTIVPAEHTVAAAVTFYHPPGSKDGPDLAFVPLPPTEFAKLTALGSAIDLDGQQAKAQRTKPEEANGHIEAVAGIVGQMTGPATVVGTRKVLSARGLINMGEVTSAPTSGQWDLLQFEPRPEPGFVLPTDYRGTSGGGMWRVYLKKKADDDFEHVETRLIGIAYWQDQIGQPPVHGIIGHGPQSLYGHLMNEIYKRWPATA